ncbi:glycoside hydrolase family 2 protein [Paenibacillus nasutitermitis]|uniref:Beta-galactosidase n=1 Tax=Paenibacillus nasutitermitis TaxID=1652958 RepID=A0A916YKQ9_9BACL|nr:glycoside hydrolase family 2 TIM barrel-domain containing protein [Paenibacillus nasutitermitis]GGD49261.1 hypothetical protein GCM10010911_03500 [Paenibacillus nasutitermitis]
MFTERAFIFQKGWRLSTDPENVGIHKEWFASGAPNAAKDVIVPGIIQQVFPDYNGIAWYWTEFDPQLSNTPTSRYLLKFGAVDYAAKIWLNGIFIGEHEGAEVPFELEVTDVLHPNARNLLAVRVINPGEEPVEGFALKQIPHMNKVATAKFTPGSSFNSGGIVMPVTLCEVPMIRFRDARVTADLHTGEVNVELELESESLSDCSGMLTATVRPVRDGQLTASLVQEINFGANSREAAVRFRMEDPHPWSTEDPYLYQIQMQLIVKASNNTAPMIDERTIRFGFRHFEVKDGYFFLNGKRVFVRSTHTGNHYPIGGRVPINRELLYKDLIFSKASGFNMVRFIAGTAIPEQLDFCDEIGLMVYEECHAAWLLEDSPQMGERFDRSTLGMVQRDRNHPSVVIWGLLNETFDGPVFRHAHQFLARLRQLDATRLVLLGSGRWDGHNAAGSVSNPHSLEWEHVWGNEEPGILGDVKRTEWYKGINGYVKGAGDAHLYPTLPQNSEITREIRSIGEGAKPIFVSEYGVGSLLDVLRGSKRYDQHGVDRGLLDARLFHSMADRFLFDWNAYGFDKAYSFPERLFEESQRLHALQRRFQFDLIRANPNVAGFNLTGMLDHAITGEGLWTFWREWKPGIVDVLADGWSPLRWCLFVDPLHAYTGKPFAIEAVLANEDVLAAGQYSASLRISHDGNVVWETAASFEIKDPAPLAACVYRDEVVLDGPEGTYEFEIILDRGGAPAGGRLEFFLSDEVKAADDHSGLVLWGINDEIEEWLHARGFPTTRYSIDSVLDGDSLVLVGALKEGEIDSLLWNRLLAAVSQGASVVFLTPDPFQVGGDPTGRLPLPRKGTCYHLRDWLYHKECVAVPHPMFEGLPTRGILDWRYFGTVTPSHLYEGQELSTDIAAAGFATGYPCQGGYKSGTVLSSHRLDAGMLILNTFKIIGNVGKNPAADRLLLNMIRYAALQE